MTTLIHLDNAATTRIDPLVRETLLLHLDDEYGNPSSRHRFGLRASDAVEAARREIARATGARAADVVFTAGGTEANNLGVLGQARARRKYGKHVLVGPTEHACVRESAAALRSEGFEVETARLSGDGALDLDDLAARLRVDTVLVAQMLVQNEFGSVYPVARVARLLRAAAPNAALHVDAVQALGKLELSLAALGADSIAISAHKAHGPKGIGALVLAGEKPLVPLVFGGGQEGGRRSGTENVAAIAAFGVAARLAEERREENTRHCADLRRVLVAGIEGIERARILEPGAPAQPIVPAILAVLLPDAPAEVRMHHLEELGVVVSAGSACQSRKRETSPALLACGLSHEAARSVLRFSLSRETTQAEIERAVEVLETVCRKLASARR